MRTHHFLPWPYDDPVPIKNVCFRRVKTKLKVLQFVEIVLSQLCYFWLEGKPASSPARLACRLCAPCTTCWGFLVLPSRWADWKQEQEFAEIRSDVSALVSLQQTSCIQSFEVKASFSTRFVYWNLVKDHGRCHCTYCCGAMLIRHSSLGLLIWAPRTRRDDRRYV